MEAKSLFRNLWKARSQNVKQNIYDTWIKNSINCTDGRNVKLSKRKYIEQYGTIKNNEVVIEEVKNKHGQILWCKPHVLLDPSRINCHNKI